MLVHSTCKSLFPGVRKVHPSDGYFKPKVAEIRKPEFVSKDRVQQGPTCISNSFVQEEVVGEIFVQVEFDVDGIQMLHRLCDIEELEDNQ